MKKNFSSFKTMNALLTVASISLLLLILSSCPYMTSVFAQNLTQSSGEGTLHIIKDATNSFTLSSGASFVGSFDTTYSIVGPVNSMQASKDLLISTITDDFGKSSTIGYVNYTATSPASQANPNQPSLPNPFATKSDIDEKIRNEISTSIDNAARSDNIEGEIKCIFGSSLDDFRCSFHGLTG